MKTYRTKNYIPLPTKNKNITIHSLEENQFIYQELINFDKQEVCIFFQSNQYGHAIGNVCNTYFHDWDSKELYNSLGRVGYVKHLLLRIEEDLMSKKDLSR